MLPPSLQGQVGGIPDPSVAVIRLVLRRRAVTQLARVISHTQVKRAQSAMSDRSSGAFSSLHSTEPWPMIQVSLRSSNSAGSGSGTSRRPFTRSTVPSFMAARVEASNAIDPVNDASSQPAG